MASENDREKPAAEDVDRQPSSAGSARETEPTKSPKTAPRPTRRPKALNTFQPASNGLLLRRIAYDAKGREIPGIRHLYKSIIGRLDSNDVFSALAAEMATADYARMAKGIEAETRYDRLTDNYLEVLAAITRYTNSSRRNLGNSLKLLRELEAERIQAQATEEVPTLEEGEWPTSEDDLPYPLRTKEEYLVEDDTLVEDWPGPSTPTAAESKSDVPQTSASRSSSDEETPATDSTPPIDDNTNSNEESMSGVAPTPAPDSVAAAPIEGADCAAGGAATDTGESAEPDLPKAA